MEMMVENCRFLKNGSHYYQLILTIFHINPLFGEIDIFVFSFVVLVGDVFGGDPVYLLTLTVCEFHSILLILHFG